MASRETIAVAGLAAVAGVILIALAYARAQHTLAGELVAAIALPGAAAPVAIASGVEAAHAIALWGAWSVGYACSVAAVRRVIACHRLGGSRVDRTLVSVFGGVVVAGGALAASLPAAAVVLPLAMIATCVVAWPPRATHLRAIGVALVVASIASAAIAIAVEWYGSSPLVRTSVRISTGNGRE
jgi:hypothetical protein